MVLTGPESASTDAGPSMDDFTTTEDHIMFYLRELRGQTLVAPVEMTLKGIKLNLKNVKLPIYELATKEDHIAPAASVFKGSLLFGNRVEFVLSGSGHIAGVINPPEKVKYQFWTAPDVAVDNFQEWMAKANEHPGSWWPHWAGWQAKHSGGWTTGRIPGARLGVIEDAPGSYVKNRG